MSAIGKMGGAAHGCLHQCVAVSAVKVEKWMSAGSRSFAVRVSWLAVMLGIAVSFAGASSDAYPLQIKVLSSEYHSLDSGTPVPRDCDMQNFSAYCNQSRNP